MSTTTDPRRAHVHGMWAGVATQWSAHADYVDDRGADLTRRLLSAARIHAGQRVLELACGTGGAGIAAAEVVGPTGEVVLSDVVDEMVAGAAARAAARGVTNVRTTRLDIEEIEEEDGTYDAVLCREGLMFAVDPQRGASEIVRVLRPGGRLAIAVWGPREENPWLALVLDAMSAELGMTLPPPGMPGPFALADSARLCDVLVAGGAVDVMVQSIPVPLHAASFEEWWSRTAAIAGPIASIIAALDADRRAAVEQRLREAVEPYASAGGVDLPGVALLASARRPASTQT